MQIDFRTAAFAALLAVLPAPARAQGSALDRAPSRFALYDGARVHFKSLGLGSTAVVFIHGWDGDFSVWRAQVPVVDGRIRALFVDLPGFGRSDKPSVEYTMEYLAGGIEAVMKAAQVERAVLVGHSMGTPVIREFYRRHPEEVVGLVAVDGALRPFMTDTAAIHSFLTQFEGPGYATNVSKMFDGLLPPPMDSTQRAAIKRVAMATPQRVSVSSMRGMMDPRIWRDDPITVPMLAVMAPNPGWNADYVAFVKRLVPGIRYETVAGAGHFVMVDHPEEFNVLLTDFLRTIKLVH